MISEAQKRAIERYREKVGRVQFNMDLNPETEKDIIDWLSRQESKRGAVKGLIRKAISDELQTKRPECP